jgi:hypothetical protein
VAEAIGIGVALSTAGLILLEYLAITRLLHAAARWRVSSVTLTLVAAMVASAPLTLIDPDGFYSALIKPSLIALWVSQLIVFAAYPSFAAKRRRRMLPAFALSAGASGLAIYGLLSTLLQQTGS